LNLAKAIKPEPTLILAKARLKNISKKQRASLQLRSGVTQARTETRTSGLLAKGLLRRVLYGIGIGIGIGISYLSLAFR
jgi:hypothetical protein